MQFYHIFDKDTIDYYIRGLRYVNCAVTALSGVALIWSVYNRFPLIYTVLITIPLPLIVTILYFINKKAYGDKIVIKQSHIEVYNMKGRFLYSLRICDMKATEQTVLFYGPRGSMLKRNCLVLYTPGQDVCEEMEYRSYIRNRNILFIQNPILIAAMIETGIPK